MYKLSKQSFQNSMYLLEINDTWLKLDDKKWIFVLMLYENCEKKKELIN